MWTLHNMHGPSTMSRHQIPKYTKDFFKVSLVVTPQTDSFGFMCPGFEISSSSTQYNRKWNLNNSNFVTHFG